MLVSSWGHCASSPSSGTKYLPPDSSFIVLPKTWFIGIHDRIEGTKRFKITAEAKLMFEKGKVVWELTRTPELFVFAQRFVNGLGQLYLENRLQLGRHTVARVKHLIIICILNKINSKGCSEHPNISKTRPPDLIFKCFVFKVCVL